MREPSLNGKPFVQCSNDELREHILPENRNVVEYGENIPSRSYAVEIAVTYAKILISERAG